jgi:hypothetical protein
MQAVIRAVRGGIGYTGSSQLIVDLEVTTDENHLVESVVLDMLFRRVRRLVSSPHRSWTLLAASIVVDMLHRRFRRLAFLPSRCCTLWAVFDFCRHAPSAGAPAGISASSRLDAVGCLDFYRDPPSAGLTAGIFASSLLDAVGGFDCCRHAPSAGPTAGISASSRLDAAGGFDFWSTCSFSELDGWHLCLAGRCWLLRRLSICSFGVLDVLHSCLVAVGCCERL